MRSCGTWIKISRIGTSSLSIVDAPSLPAVFLAAREWPGERRRHPGSNPVASGPATPSPAACPRAVADMLRPLAP